MVEFVVAAPLLLVLAFGIFDFGRGMSANVTVTNSAREGARYLSVNAIAKGATNSYGDACPIQSPTITAPSSDSGQGKAWRQLADASMDLSKVTMTVKFYSAAHDPATTTTADVTVTCSTLGVMTVSNPASTTLQPGDWVVFEVDYSYAPSTPFISKMFALVTLSRTATMVLE